MIILIGLLKASIKKNLLTLYNFSWLIKHLFKIRNIQIIIFIKYHIFFIDKKD